MFEAAEFISEGAILRGRLYRPQRATPFPVVVMTHGTTATITMAIDRYAEEFCRGGLGVLLYDHRNLGASDGEPRQEMNPWIQARGYRDAITFLQSRTDVRGDRIAVWGDSYSGLIALVVAALDERVAAVAVHCPTCGAERPAAEPSDMSLEQMRAVLRDGDVSGTPETTLGPMPVVSVDQAGTPSLLKPIQAFKWFIEYGGRHGSLWENLVTRVVPPTPVPFSAYLAAPYIRCPVFMMVGLNDEMPHCNYDVSRATFGLMCCPKAWAEIEGGHFGLLYCPSDLFDLASSAQRDFLMGALNGEARAG
jgi:pimeloyl-ACP methyl ester carboxylesterase